MTVSYGKFVSALCELEALGVQWVLLDMVMFLTSNILSSIVVDGLKGRNKDGTLRS